MDTAIAQIMIQESTAASGRDLAAAAATARRVQLLLARVRQRLDQPKALRPAKPADPAELIGGTEASKTKPAKVGGLFDNLSGTEK